MRRDDILRGGEEVVVQRFFGRTIHVDGARPGTDFVGFVDDRGFIVTQAGWGGLPRRETQSRREQ